MGARDRSAAVGAWSLVVGLLVVGLLSGCKVVGGSDKKPVAEPGAEQAAPAATAPSAAWIAGDLKAQRPDEARLKPKPGGEVVVQVYANPPSLNSISDNDWWGTRLTRGHVYEQLVAYDNSTHPRYDIVPQLAERFEVSEDKKTFTFYLRKDVKFHDGKPLTSRDVKATYDKMLDPTTKAAHYRAHFEELDSFKVIDDYTIQFTFKRAYYMARDAFTLVPIQPAHIIEKLTGAQYNEANSNPLNRAPVGTGPFKFVQWVPNSKIVFARNEQYRGDKALLDRLVFRIVLDPAIGLQLAERGELDVVTRVLPEPWVSMAKNEALVKRFHRSSEDDNNYAWLGWNLKRPYFSDKRVRRALTMLVDRPSILKNLFHGVYEDVDCHFYKRADYLCATEKGAIPYDPKAAAKLLDEAGWKDSDGDGVRDKDGVKFAFTFLVPAASENSKRMLAMVKDDFERAGIDMSLQLTEWSAYTEPLRDGSFDACTMLWVSDVPTNDPTQVWHSKSQKGGSNYIGFENKRADEILETARVTFDDDKRNALYREFGDILRDEQPYTFVYTRPRPYMYAHRVRGVNNTLVSFNFAQWWIHEG